MIWTRRSAPDAPVPTKVRTLLTRLMPTGKPVAPMSMHRWELVIVTVLAIGSVFAVAAIAAIISYSHMRDWALANHEPGWRATLFPLSVDGAILAASLVLYADSRSGRRADKLAYVIVLVGIAWSIGANVGHAWVSDAAEKLIAGWPPAAMAVSVELLLRFVRRWRGQADRAAKREGRKTKPAPVPVQPQPRPAPEPELDECLPLHVVKPDRPEWLPANTDKAKQAIEAYLSAHPGADGAEVHEAVSPHFRLADGYARRLVREHRKTAVGEE